MRQFNDSQEQPLSDISEYKEQYGPNAVINQVGHITIVHLDNPSKTTQKKRIQEVVDEELSGEAFEDNCPLCQSLKDRPYDVIYPAEFENDL